RSRCEVTLPPEAMNARAGVSTNRVSGVGRPACRRGGSTGPWVDLHGRRVSLTELRVDSTGPRGGLPGRRGGPTGRRGGPTGRRGGPTWWRGGLAGPAASRP